MSEAYYHDDGFEPTYRSPNRHNAARAQYARRGPYDYSDHYERRRHYARQRYDDQQASQDDEQSNQGEQARKRIAVACQRCRKRKIKCTGDPGNGSGCGACKTAGPAPAQDCTFIRVKSEPMQMAQLEMLTHDAYPGLTNASNFYEREGRGMERHQRSRRHVPVLHTRSAYASDLDLPAHNSPIDAYTYVSSAPSRQDSLSATYATENLRSWATTCSTALPPTTTYCDPYSAPILSSMSYPIPQQFGRLPRLSTESLSSLNMGHLHSSLPSHGTADRRLPVPYTSQYHAPPWTESEATRARPLGSFSIPKLPMNAAHTRHALPWTLDTSNTRTGSISSYSAPMGLLSTSSQTMPGVTDAAYSNHFNTTSALASYGSYRSSPDVSPTSGHPQSTSFGSSSASSGSGDAMHPRQMAAMHYYPVASSQQDMPAYTASERPPTTHQRVMQNMPSLYSYGTVSSEQQLQEQEDNMTPSSGVDSYSHSLRHGQRSNQTDAGSYIDDSNDGYQPTLQHPRPLPQHRSSIDNMCRQSSFEQQARQSSTTGRMSISNFNGVYQ